MHCTSFSCSTSWLLLPLSRCSSVFTLRSSFLGIEVFEAGKFLSNLTRRTLFFLETAASAEIRWDQNQVTVLLHYVLIIILLKSSQKRPKILVLSQVSRILFLCVKRVGKELASVIWSVHVYLKNLLKISLSFFWQSKNLKSIRIFFSEEENLNLKETMRIWAFFKNKKKR